ncbi:MAG: hypothetical protein IKZ96_03885 [Bacilli bacterium]|nr:hypothetical protein [Bacilli bacterium]
MEKRMNKEELLELLGTLKIVREEFWVLSSGALVLRGILEDAGDLDIGVTDKGLSMLRDNYDVEIIKGNHWCIKDSRIEGFNDGSKSNLKFQPELLESGYYVQNILDYYNFLISSTREKDIKRIPIIESYIKTYKQK